MVRTSHDTTNESDARGGRPSPRPGRRRAGPRETRRRGVRTAQGTTALEPMDPRRAVDALAGLLVAVAGAVREPATSCAPPRKKTQLGGIVGRTSVCVTPTDEGIQPPRGGRRARAGRAAPSSPTESRRDVSSDGDCHGWERSEWSDPMATGCSRSASCRARTHRPAPSSGISLMATSSSWVDIQFVSQGDREQLELRRYSPMTPGGDGEDGSVRLCAARGRRPTIRASRRLGGPDALDPGRDRGQRAHRRRGSSRPCSSRPSLI